MNKNSNIVLGAVLIVLGCLFLLSNLGYMSFSWDYIWPMALLIPGLYLHFSFFTGLDRNPGILVPAGILTTYGALFYINVFFGWHLFGSLWPLLLLGIALGLFELFLFGNRDKGLLIPIVILGGIGISSLTGPLISELRKYLIPVVLIILGLAVILKKKS